MRYICYSHRWLGFAIRMWQGYRLIYLCIRQLHSRKILDTLAFWNFSVQLSETNPFGRCEADRVIQTTINKETKTAGGLTGFSTKFDAVDRRTVNAAYCASLYSHLQEFFGTNTKNYVHTDLQKWRIRNDQYDVTSMLSIIIIKLFYLHCSFIWICPFVETNPIFSKLLVW